MKILKIFGAVVAVHGVAFLLIFAIPGCNTTSKPVAAAPAESTGPAPVITVPGSSNSSTASTPTLSVPDTTAMADASAASAAAATPRYSPTRPGTAVASAVLAQPVSDVTPVRNTYTVVNGDNLTVVAKKNQTTIKELAAANNLSTSAKLKLGQKLLIPGQAAVSSSPGTAASDPSPKYKVMPGDTLAVIAKRNGTTTTALKSLNNLKSDTVRANQELKLPAGSGRTADAPSAPATAEGAPNAPSGSFTHVVQPGENLGTIARKYQVKYSDIAVANNITNPALIKAGMTLVIPGWQAPKSAKPSTAASTAADQKPPVMGPGSQPAVDPGSPPASSSEVPVIKVEDSPPASSTLPKTP